MNLSYEVSIMLQYLKILRRMIVSENKGRIERKWIEFKLLKGGIILIN